MQYTRQQVISRLRTQIELRQAIVCAGAGTGISAKFIERGGADLIMVYNSGRFRMAGHSSLCGLLALGDANETVMQMGAREILPVVQRTPVIAGVNGTDPTRNMPRFLERVLDVGFAGVINFPTMGIIDGRWRQSLEETGFSYALEVDMIAAAGALGLYTMAYTFNDDEVRQMASVGVDVVVAHLGTTVGGLIGADPANTPSLDDAVQRTQQMADVARAEHPGAIVLTHGGPIATPAEVREVLARTSAQGFVGASTMERLPVEQAIGDTVRAFKDLPLQPDAGA